MISIIPYEKKYQPDFKRLNLYWLEKYHLTEQYDLDILDDPQGKVIDPGGCIFLAMDDEKVVGTAGLAKENETVYELVKMSVDLNYHGKGIGKILLERCLEEATRLKAKKIILFSNSQLVTALRMYENYGFRHVDVIDAPFLTADVKMELCFSTNAG
ncbi:MAG: GNAT family N-acetyltransferase [Chitinophagaceae bacterium]|nr:GNAT family N-acetyltransferase [Chitinophagaceae bacterium]